MSAVFMPFSSEASMIQRPRTRSMNFWESTFRGRSSENHSSLTARVRSRVEKIARNGIRSIERIHFLVLPPAEVSPGGTVWHC